MQSLSAGVSARTFLMHSGLWAPWGLLLSCMSYGSSWTCEWCRDERGPSCLSEFCRRPVQCCRRVCIAVARLFPTTPHEITVHNEVMFSEFVYISVNTCERDVTCQHRETLTRTPNRFELSMCAAAIPSTILSSILLWPLAGTSWLNRSFHGVLGTSDLQGHSHRLHPGRVGAAGPIPAKAVQRRDAGEHQSSGLCGWVCRQRFVYSTRIQNSSHMPPPLSVLIRILSWLLQPLGGNFLIYSFIYLYLFCHQKKRVFLTTLPCLSCFFISNTQDCAGNSMNIFKRMNESIKYLLNNSSALYTYMVVKNLFMKIIPVIYFQIDIRLFWWRFCVLNFF